MANTTLMTEKQEKYLPHYHEGTYLMDFYFESFISQLDFDILWDLELRYHIRPFIFKWDIYAIKTILSQIKCISIKKS